MCKYCHAVDHGTHFKYFTLLIILKKKIQTRESVVCNNTFKLVFQNGSVHQKYHHHVIMYGYKLEMSGPTSEPPIKLCIFPRYPDYSHVHSSLRSHVVS